MKTTLLLLWSLASFPLQDNCTSCQGVAGSMGAGAYSSNGHGYSDPNAGAGSVAGMSGQFGMSDGEGYGEFNSPCRDCRGGKGRCHSCCKDSTCNMYQHYPYQPDNHGYYYFHPYNYTAVWQHQQWITTIGGIRGTRIPEQYSFRCTSSLRTPPTNPITSRPTRCRFYRTCPENCPIWKNC